MRNNLFRHLDGIVTCPTAFALWEKGVTEHLLSSRRSSLSDLSEKFNANEGYLNVALRILCSQGWLEQHLNNETDSIEYSTNAKSEIAFSHFEMYAEAAELLRISENYHPRLFELEPFLKLERLYTGYKDNFGIEMSSDPSTSEIQQQILKHIEGIIVGPTLVHLGMSGMFHKYFMETRFKAEEFHKDPENFERLLNILVELGWFEKSNDSFKFTDRGMFFAKRASAYGVTVSYVPTLRKLNELIFGNPKFLKGTGPQGEEKHVDREMNVWGSGGAHSAYFKVVDEIIIDLFNKPLPEQPKGILDMGCGNGAFLKHMYSVIEQQTMRGTMLEDYPLLLIGVDFNEAALNVSKKNLIQAEIWAKIIWGDIGNPEGLAKDLQANYDIDLSDLLNVRSFLDHNRIWEYPESNGELRTSSSTGAFAFEGARLGNNLVSESLRQHFLKWLPYVSKYGLLLIELHTVAPELVAKNLGRSPSTAYDATHGFSDQYIVEIDEFLQVMKDTGLKPDPVLNRKFPDNELASVSVNLFKAGG